MRIVRNLKGVKVVTHLPPTTNIEKRKIRQQNLDASLGPRLPKDPEQVREPLPHVPTLPERLVRRRGRLKS